MDLPLLDSLPRPRLLACDIDGTLLDSGGKIRPAVRDAIRVIAASGVRVVLATGRSPWGGVRLLADTLGLDGPQITMQGAVISDPATGRVHQLRPIPSDLYRDALVFAEELGIDPVVALIDGHRATRLPTEVDFVAATAEHNFRPEDDLRRLADAAPIRVFLPTGPERHPLVRAAATRRFAGRASLVWTDLWGVEILAHGTNKGQAVGWLADRLGITLDEVAAVGDAANDTEMLRASGRSAAMASAPPEVQAAADIVVGACDDDGILDAFGWFFPDLALLRT